MIRSRWTGRLLAGLLGLVLVGDGLAIAAHGGPSHPKVWDARVLPIVEFVERERGLLFEHPVHVEFLSDAEFRREVVPEEEPTASDKAEIANVEALFRSLGLIGADVDLLAEVTNLSGEGTVGLYLPDEDRIKVRGSELSPLVRTTLAHELTHALQAQHFDLDVDEDEFDTDGASSAFTAVVEGDASMVEDAFVDDVLSDAEAASLDEVEATVGAKFDDTPPVLLSLFGAPYVLGDAFMQLVIADGGNAARDAALSHPPVSEEQLLDPWRYLASDAPKTVEVPRLRGGEKAIADAEGDFGAITWYLVLAQRIDPKVALAAVDGWGGDDYVGFRRGGSVCTRAAFKGDSATDDDEMRAALTQWAAAAPAPTTTVTSAGALVVLESCDPGRDKRVPAGPDTEMLNLPVSRTYGAAGARSAGGTARQARCVGGGLIARLTTEQLVGSDAEADLAAMRLLGQQIGEACL